MNRETGGPAFSVTRLAAEQAKLGHEVTVAALDYKRHGPAVDPAPAKLDLTKADFLAVHGRGWSPAFARRVRELARNVDVVHNHALWMWPNKYARCAANESGKPLVISTRGMLEGWSLGRSAGRKFVAWHLFERKNLESAALFHATSESEAEAIATALRSRLRSKYGELSVKGDRRWEIGDRGTDSSGGGRREVEGCEFGIRNSEIGKKLSALSVSAVQKGYRRGAESAEGWPRRSGALQSDSSWPRIVVAPNGVDVPEKIPGREILEEKFPKLRGKEWVLFMSRIHPKKGIDVLLEAWKEQMAAAPSGLGLRLGLSEIAGGGSRVTGNDPSSISQTPSATRTTVLVIAGADLIGYGAEVERMIREKGLGETVLMTGHVDGEVREALLGNAKFFVLPSYSENFGLVVAESLARGRPVITTTGTPWKELKEWGAGWWVEPKKESITQAMGEALTKTDVELDQMGTRGRKMVGERFSWKGAAETVVDGYKELVDRR